MSDSQRSTNPLQFLVLALASLFTLTVCSYCVMYLRQGAASAGTEPSAAGRWLLQLMERRGETILALQLALLAAATLAAMLRDRREC
jgi:ferredoxin